MNVLLIGGGGREHAIAWKITQSEHLEHLYIAPGNAGTSALGQNIPLNADSFDEVRAFVLKSEIDLVIVGPEAPLVDGLADKFKADRELSDVLFFGPGQAGAMLEGSKDWAKAFMKRHKIPTALSETFTKDTIEQGKDYLATRKPPFVLKADGLAAGKGVLIIEDLAEAQESLSEMLEDEKFGSASSKVVVEDFLSGIELSVFVITDGNSYKILPEAKDYKRIGEGDTGLNTGGMGSISPVPFADKTFMQKVEQRIIRPTIHGLKAENIPYCGFIFFGLISVQGDPYVIEYNVRMGDPEAESVVPRIKSDLLELIKAAAEGQLKDKTVEFEPAHAAAVMMVSGGYPGAYEKGKAMSGFEDVENSILFHAGTKKAGNETVTSGGRVIAITSLAENMQEALKQSYENCERIRFEGSYYRKDLGKDLEKYL